jgi:hypothetical protein
MADIDAKARNTPSGILQGPRSCDPKARNHVAIGTESE